MAIAYARVLQKLTYTINVVGRGKTSCENFHNKTGIRPIADGLKNIEEKILGSYHMAIVAVDIDQLASVTQTLIRGGVRRILLEKPGGLSLSELRSTNDLAISLKCDVFIAYNRRFYASTRKALEMINQDGGITSIYFEFTERSHIITTLPIPDDIKQEWFLANSSHVCDLAFYIAGKPRLLSAYVQGSLDWHKTGAQFCGSGITEKGVLFSYHSNWASAGRWGLELCTAKRRLFLRPLEELHEQKTGESECKPVLIVEEIDRQFKPGLFAQTQAFLAEQSEQLLSLEEQCKLIENCYQKMVPNCGVQKGKKHD
jgi:predicted dehydrogenase